MGRTDVMSAPLIDRAARAESSGAQRRRALAEWIGRGPLAPTDPGETERVFSVPLRELAQHPPRP